MSKEKSLGLVSLPERTIEHDLAMLERFQDFSAELLRLALLGISAIGFGASKLLFPDQNGADQIVLENVKVFLAVSLIGFCIAVASSLFHRYASADSMSWHIQAMRRYIRGNIDDVQKADSEAVQRYRRFIMSKIAIASASISLGIGALSLAIAVWRSI
jgi:hypothetical protein